MIAGDGLGDFNDQLGLGTNIRRLCPSRRGTATKQAGGAMLPRAEAQRRLAYPTGSDLPELDAAASMLH